MASIGTYPDKPTPVDTDKLLVSDSADGWKAKTTAFSDFLKPTTYVSSGVVTLPTITDNEDGTISIGTDGLYNFYKNSTATNGIAQLAVETALVNQTLADETASFIYADYNSGVPFFAVTTNVPDYLLNLDWIPVFRVYRSGNSLHILNYDAYGTASVFKVLYKDIALKGFERQSGLTLSTAATRISTVSLGSAWFAVQPYSLAANVAGTTGQLYEFYLTAGVWSSVLVTEYDASYYSDGINRLDLGLNKYVAKYFFRAVGELNQVYYTHGNQYNTALLAYDEGIPSPPPEISSHSIFVGKIVIQKSATNGVAYPRLWTGTALTAGATNHSDLANIELAAAGVTAGHINDQAQMLEGVKTFSSAIAVDRITTAKVWHAYGGFQDQAVVIDVPSVGVWTWITNPTHTLWAGTEADGLSVSGDIMTVANTGDYRGNLSLTLSGINAKDFKLRLYNITTAAQCGYYIGATTTGASNFTNIALPLYFEATAGDTFRIEITCSTDGSDPTVRSSVFTISYLHD